MRTFHNMTLRRIILIFIIAILVPTILLTTLVQVSFIDKLYQQASSELCLSVQALKYELDNVFSGFDKIANYCYIDDDFTTPQKEYDYYCYTAVRDKLYFLTYSNPLIEECAVYFPGHAYLMSEQSTYQIKYYYRKYKPDGYTEQEFEKYLKSQDTPSLLYGSSNGSRYTLYIHPLYNERHVHKMTLIFATKDESYSPFLKSALYNEGSCVYIRSDDNHIISSCNTDKERSVDFYSQTDFYDLDFQNKTQTYQDAFITVLHSDYNPLTYNLVIRRSAVTDTVLRLQFLWISIVVIVLIVAFALALICGFISYKPLGELKTKALDLYNADENTDDYHYLAETMEYISHKNNLLQNSLDEINDYIIFKVLTGQYSGDNEINRISQLISVSLKRSLFRVITVIDQNRNGYRSFYQTCLRIFSDNVHFLIHRENNDSRYTVILIYDLEKITENDILTPNFPQYYTLTVGSLQKSCRWVAMSYAEALFSSTYNNETTTTLSSALLTENYETAQYVIEQCIESTESMSLNEIVLMCLNISLTMSDVCRQYEPHTDISPLPDVMTLLSYKTREQGVDFLRHNILSIIDRLNHKETKIYHDSFEEMKQYIKEHYRDIDFSFQLMADNFGISLSALSKRFTAYANTTLNDYTTDLKITRAKDLLLETEMSINEISMEVGYLSPNSFIRRFKQITSLSPGEFRKTNKKKPNNK